MRILVTGAGGMLGFDVVRAVQRAKHLAIPLSKEELDVTDAEAVAVAFAEGQPDVIVNCAAFTDVDGAESDPAAAAAVNVDGAGNLASAASRIGAPLVHISTDYVFGGQDARTGGEDARTGGEDARTGGEGARTGGEDAPAGGQRSHLSRSSARAPYLESDAPAPGCVYGASKLEGELLVLRASPRNIVVRTSWLFGLGGRNFAQTMLSLGAERDHVEVVDDQVGCPTWTGHLAPALVGLIERQIEGLVHLAGSGSVSWNGFAKEIFRQAGISCEVLPISTAQAARRAPRPSFSAIESGRSDVLPMPDWRDGLAGYLAARAGMIKR